MGIPNYPPLLDGGHLQPFYDGLAAGELRLTCDAATGAWRWYPPELPDAPLAWRRAADTGTIYTFSRVERSLLPGDHKAEVPFTVVLVEPDDAPGCRVPGLFVGDGDAARCGLAVRLHPVEVDGHLIAGFAPA